MTKKKEFCLFLAGMAVAGACTSAYRLYEDWYFRTKYVTYFCTVEKGGTVWGACAKIASNKDDLSRVVWQTCRDSGIDNPGTVQEGTVLKVTVRRLLKDESR